MRREHESGSLCKVSYKNIPEHYTLGFIVARLVDTDLWYYGVYETQERAEEVAAELGNGVVMLAI